MISPRPVTVGCWCAGFYLLSALLAWFTLGGEAVGAGLVSCRGGKGSQDKEIRP